MSDITLPPLSDELSSLSQSDFIQFGDAVVALISQADSESALSELRGLLQGKKSPITALSKQMGGLTADDKKTYGAYLHELRTRINTALDERGSVLAKEALNAKLLAEQIDITLPPRHRPTGGLHPITHTTERMKQFFVQAGFSVATGPEVESD
ncbi:MAG: phenylalanine--tRNA ligase subunit alpha, partial [Moraxella sp.]|nr:phenylalanine--tRNA ligase subunit alpha [Moraxella sp.]